MTTVTLPDIERYYDAVPRPMADAVEVGPFTLFVPHPTTDWQFYARPRLGLTEHVLETDVRLLFDRQVELGRPRNLEWVHQTTPSLLPAVRRAVGMAASAGIAVELAECPLLVLPSDTDHTAGLPAYPPFQKALVRAVAAVGVTLTAVSVTVVVKV